MLLVIDAGLRCCIDLVVGRPDRHACRPLVVRQQAMSQEQTDRAGDLERTTSAEEPKSRRARADSEPDHGGGGTPTSGRSDDSRAGCPGRWPCRPRRGSGSRRTPGPSPVPSPTNDRATSRKNTPAIDLDRHHELPGHAAAVLGAEEDLLRRPLPADVDRAPCRRLVEPRASADDSTTASERQREHRS